MLGSIDARVSSFTRRTFLASTAAIGSRALVLTSITSSVFARTPVAQNEGELSLSTLPVRVFKTSDPGKEDSESWRFHLVLDTVTVGDWRCDELEVVAKSAGKLSIRTVHQGVGLTAIRTDFRSAGPASSQRRTLALLRIVGSAPRAAAIDSLTCTVKATAPDAASRSVSVDVPIRMYEQRSALTFPFRGHGLITQGGAADGGHANRSGQFAVDAIGLTPMYAPQLNAEDVNSAAAGWGREIVAPAAGVIVRVRADRPDQTLPGTSDPAYYAPEFKDGGDPGNHVVIDHGNGEFSMVAHFQKDSVFLSSGDRIAAGDPLGLLGNSGDSTFPHVHYQLMDGPDWQACDALPHRFANMPAKLVRGTWFHARA